MFKYLFSSNQEIETKEIDIVSQQEVLNPLTEKEKRFCRKLYKI